MKVDIHPHAIARMNERGATRNEVEYTVGNGKRRPAKYGRTRFAHTFPYNREWYGKRYGRKLVEAYAVDRGTDDWFVVTVIVKYF
jgi:hypothetical protein